MNSSPDINQFWTDSLLQTMIHADRSGAAALIEEAFTAGFTPDSVILQILDPALFRLGQLWGEESVSLAQTFVAAKIAEDVLLLCMPKEGSAKEMTILGIAVIGNIEDDFHSLGRRIVGSFLRANGWTVYDLGNDVSAEQFVEKAVEVGASVIGASAMMQTTALNIRKLRSLIDGRGLAGRIKIAVGGAVFNWRPELVAEVGGDGSTRNATGASELFLRLQAMTAREKK